MPESSPRLKFALLIGAAALFAAAAAYADDPPPKPLRLIGEGPAPKTGPARRFVIDAVVKPGDGEFQSNVEGWFAGLDDADPPRGSISGSCVEKRCALTATVQDGKMIFTGDLLDAAGPVTARFTAKDDDDKVAGQGAATLRPLTGPITGLGALAAADAIDAATLEELLAWTTHAGPSGESVGDPPTDLQRDSLADWQKDHDRPATGLIFPIDLTQMRAEVAAARKTAAWTMLGDKAHGWSAGYSAALLPKASRVGAEQRFASADGKALLVVAIDPPMSGAEFDALVDRETADHPDRESVGYNRSNGDMDLNYEQKGVVHVLAWRNHEGALARMVYTYPSAAADTYSTYDTLLAKSFKVSDDVKR
jgi:hypothetical protein